MPAGGAPLAFRQHTSDRMRRSVSKARAEGQGRCLSGRLDPINARNSLFAGVQSRGAQWGDILPRVAAARAWLLPWATTSPAWKLWARFFTSRSHWSCWRLRRASHWPAMATCAPDARRGRLKSPPRAGFSEHEETALILFWRLWMPFGKCLREVHHDAQA